MPYTKTNWKDKTKPSINAENLNKLESGVYQAHEFEAENRIKIEELSNKYIELNEFSSENRKKIQEITKEFAFLKERVLLIKD